MLSHLQSTLAEDCSKTAYLGASRAFVVAHETIIATTAPVS